MQAALDISGPGSRIVYFGLPGPQDQVRVPALDTMVADKTIRFSWLAPLTWPTAVQALATGLVNVKPAYHTPRRARGPRHCADWGSGAA